MTWIANRRRTSRPGRWFPDPQGTSVSNFNAVMQCTTKLLMI